LLAVPCDENGNALPPGSSPPPRYPADATPSNPWNPFDDRLAFQFADYHFTELQSSEAQISRALDHWLASTIVAGGDANNIPWKTAEEMYTTIDAIKEGPAPWKIVKFQYTGPLPPGTPPRWMLETWELCFRDPRIVLLNQIALPDIQDHFNYVPYMQFNEKKDRVFSNLLSGSWAWDEAVRGFIRPVFHHLLICNRMILFMTTHQHEDLCLFQLLREVIKQQYLLRLGIKNFIQSTLVPEIWTIHCGAHVLWGWSQLLFFLFRRVSF
jgi:Plavaka transposase